MCGVLGRLDPAEQLAAGISFGDRIEVDAPLVDGLVIAEEDGVQSGAAGSLRPREAAARQVPLLALAAHRFG